MVGTKRDRASRILVTGASGNIGTHLTAMLDERGETVRAFANVIDPADLPARVEVVRGELGDATAIADALVDADRALLLLPPSNMEGLAQVATTALSGSDVRHVVMVSSLAVEDHSSFGEQFRNCERLVEGCGVPWTFLRLGTLMSNTLTWSGSIKAGGAVTSIVPDYPSAPVDPYDVAAVAVVALTEPGHEHQAYDLTGSERIRPSQQVGAIAKAIGSEIAFKVASEEEAVVMLVRQFGSSEDQARGMVAEQRRPDLPWNEPRGTLERLLGRPARTFSEWVADHVEAFS